MTLPSKPFADLPHEARSSHPLDGLLRAYFQAQLPEPWPEIKLPAQPAVAGKQALSGRRPQRYSRLALAAAVLLLFIGHFCLSGLYSDPVPAELYPAKFEATNRSRSKPIEDKLSMPQPGNLQLKAKTAKKNGEMSVPR
jgi:hypothetical protein